mmetsp:Transcript_10511/g.28873  ORF Transcript_10511/g.28873 Transcript_10511/m.28873 type:complete len:218 (+) Transcript_10511:50-703(+)
MSLCTSQSVCGLRNALVQSRKFSSSKCSATSASPRPVRASASGCSGTDGTDCTAANRFGVLGVVGLKALNVASRFSAKVSQLSTVSDADAEAINGQIQANLKGMRTLAMVVPFAAVSGSSSTFMILTKAVASFIKLYLLLLFVRVLLSWFPTFTKWEEQPWSALRQVTDPYLKLFSGLVRSLISATVSPGPESLPGSLDHSLTHSFDISLARTIICV